MTRISLKRIVHIVISLLFFSPTNATSLTSDDLIVDNVAVIITDQSAPKAREAAILEAEKKGLLSLAERQSIAIDATLLEQIPPSQIQQNVKALVIVREKTSPTKYAATFKITYKPSAIQKLLGSSKIKNDAVTSCVVLPYFKNENHTELWGDENPWFNAWTSAKLPASLVLPLGDLSDMKLLQANAPLSFEQLKPILSHYDSRCALVSILKQEVNGSLTLVNYKIKDASALATPEQKIQGNYDAALIATLDLYETEKFSIDASKIFNVAGEQTEASKTNIIKISVSYDNFKEWQEIKRNLTHLTGLTGMFVDKLEKKTAIVSLHYSVSQQAFLESLNKSGFDFISESFDSQKKIRVAPVTQEQPEHAESLELEDIHNTVTGADQEDYHEERT